MFDRRFGIIAMAALVGGLWLAATAYAAGKNSFTLQSSAFAQNGNIPDAFSCFGKNVSPPLAWSGVPEKTQSLVLILDDPDGSKKTAARWIMYNIPVKLAGLPDATALPPDAKEGADSANAKGYRGPCAPSGRHHYVFTLYALDQALDIAQPPTKAKLASVMTGHVLGQATLTGQYQKPKPKPPTLEDLASARASRPK